ncbi:MAG: Peptidase M42 family protein [candidate division TA06 bacterium 32_111]|uniref:Peptidase M42 family protein n=2 Tax=Bacteria candidate phyla TaxID=1783234 RepID=A0A117M6R3_UNCT6|nr:MAG: Peptidase M42 family protein [candidate division TA06 bacterium 32_111]KUK87399.1 MAG: Peptidase M42 family protein [candidate division TA06 bacterium 34_109]HAF07767.1 peptidase M42 [candidate division WOR-3 bacterium]HCP17285.1 peptidase M42 [candidate division WOR-3 bacterium]
MILKNLSEGFGPSGNESEVRDFIIETIKDHVDSLKIDRMGNIIAYKKGKSKKSKKVLLGAHMDEVGFMIKSIEESGILKFLPAGGIDKRVVIGKNVLIGKDKVKGVICYKPVHLQRKDYNNIPDFNSLVIDIGSTEKKDAEKYVSVGDYAVFDTKFEKRGNIIKGKSFDDRLGCAAIIEILKERYENDIYGVFFVQEEVGLRGSKASVFNIPSDYAIVLEGTSAADMPHSKDEPDYPKMGEGVVLTISDRSLFVDKELFRETVSCAKENRIKYQFKQPMVGGTDGGEIHKSREGVKTIVFAVPSRYIHSPVSFADLRDYRSMIDLTKKLLNKLK